MLHPPNSLQSSIKFNKIRSIRYVRVYNLPRENYSFETLLSDADAVYIATPHLSHYTLTKQAILAKKHVLCEIPLVLEAEQARELYELAEKNCVIPMEAV